MYKVLYVPQLTRNLFSVRAAAYFIQFGNSCCWIRDSDGKLNGMGTLVEKLYQLDCETITSEQASV